MSAEKRLSDLQLELPPPPAAVGVYKPAITVGNICYTSGHVPLLPDGSMIRGCVGRDGVQAAEGYDAAKQCGLAILATLKSHLGSLDKVKRVIKIVGMVNSVPEFDGHPTVINGCSDLMKGVFGEDAGVGARSAVGMSGLPLGVMVEVEAIFELN
jgi:enamine deaminase RidA (YjgF/YER057c/UK114 family)